jgi:hypothetical protein
MIRALIVLTLLIRIMNAADPIEFRTIEQGNFSGVQTAMQLVVTNSAQWQELWARHSAQKIPGSKAPEINFDQETIFFVALGRQSSGGHKIEIAEVKTTDGKTEVVVKTRAPRPGGFRLQALSAPFHIVAIPKITKPVKFAIEESASSPR